MAASLRVGVIVGSLASDSINRRLAQALPPLAPEDMELTPLDVSRLPFYNRDLESNVPQAAGEFRAALQHVDAILIVSPEHNRGIPGLVVTALEWGSRPKSASPLMGMPAAVIGGSPGKIGTAVMQAHLRPMLAACGCPVLSQPEAYLEISPSFFAEDGSIASSGTRDFLNLFLVGFQQFASKFVD